MSSKRAMRRRECEGKQAFPTAAIAAMYNKTGAKKFGWQRLHAYKCEFCHQFHLGHPPRKIRRILAQVNGKFA